MRAQSAPRGARIDVDDDSDEFEGWEFVEDGEEVSCQIVAGCGILVG